MCGINGYASAEAQPADLDSVRGMNAALRHRGPDDGGVQDVGFATVGMRRLSIVDIAGGAQPMSTVAVESPPKKSVDARNA